MACFASVRVFFVVFISYILQSSAFTTLLSPAMRGKGCSLHRHLRRRCALFVSSPPQNSSSGMRDYRISKPVRREVELEVQAEESERKSEHTHFMRLALRHAQHAFREKEVPIGAVIADPNGKIIATGRNQVEKHQDPTVITFGSSSPISLHFSFQSFIPPLLLSCLAYGVILCDITGTC